MWWSVNRKVAQRAHMRVGSTPSQLSASNATLNRIESDHCHIKRRLRSMHGPRTLTTACAVIAGIQAVQMIRKGQVLGITKKNLHGQAWIFGSLLGLN
jgi:transposase-like protein